MRIMPVYTYKCDTCEYHFDQFQHFTDDPLTICPNCGSITLRKVYQPVGIVFKGKGFYATDNRSPSGQSFTNNHKTDSAESSGGNGSGHKAEEPASTAESTGTKETA